MVKHIVFWKVKDNAEKQQNIDRMIDMLKSLVGKIEGLISIEVGYNFNQSSDYDVVLYAAFTNPSALKYYQNHPEHLKCKEFISQVTVDRTCADYFFESDMLSKTEPAEIPQNTAETPAVPEITIETPAVPEITIETPAVPEITFETPAVSEVAVETPAVPEVAVETPAVPETNPFGVEINTGAVQSSLPNIQADTDTAVADIAQQFSDAQPSVQGYNPQIKTEEQLDVNKPEENYQAPDLSFIKAQGKTEVKQTKFENDLNDQTDKDHAQPLEPIDFSYVPPAAPMKFDPDSSSYNFGGNAQPQPSQNMSFNNTPVSTPVAPPPAAPARPRTSARTAPAAPMTYQPAPQQPAPQRTATRTARTPAKTPQNAQVNPVSTEHSKIKETTNAFGKKKIDVEVTPLEQRADVWTCPNCGKVMPNYVGTCGCGEIKPFDFKPFDF